MAKDGWIVVMILIACFAAQIAIAVISGSVFSSIAALCTGCVLFFTLGYEIGSEPWRKLTEDWSVLGASMLAELDKAYQLSKELEKRLRETGGME